MRKTLFINDSQIDTVDWDIEERVVVLENDNRLSADLTTRCKSWRTALKRFFKGLTGIDDLTYQWMEEMIESCENGTFKLDCEGCCGAWEVEEIDGGFYISLIKFKEQEQPAQQMEENKENMNELKEILDKDTLLSWITGLDLFSNDRKMFGKRKQLDSKFEIHYDMELKTRYYDGFTVEIYKHNDEMRKKVTDISYKTNEHELIELIKKLGTYSHTQLLSNTYAYFVEICDEETGEKYNCQIVYRIKNNSMYVTHIAIDNMQAHKAVLDDKYIYSENQEAMVCKGFTFCHKHYTWSEYNECYYWDSDGDGDDYYYSIP